MIRKGAVRKARKLTSLFNAGVRNANPGLRRVPINHAAHTMASNPMVQRGVAAGAAAKFYAGMPSGLKTVKPNHSAHLFSDAVKKAQRPTKMSQVMAGKGKYIAGAVVAGGVVGGAARTSRGADKAIGRPTGMYQF